MTISVEVIAHSAYKTQWSFATICTMKLRYPRFIHSEFMTHRDFSRNASSSRAIPVRKMIEQVKDDIAMPVEWGKNRPGMKATSTIMNTVDAELEWHQSAWDTIYRAEKLASLDLHKQTVNRILEPYAHISVIVTSTQWDNFFNLRCSPEADPTMRALAEAMREALHGSVPELLPPGGWHLPFARPGPDDMQRLFDSAAACARVSYQTHDGRNPTVEENADLAARLLDQWHMSPFEHQARPARGRFYNLHGWRSFRYDLENPDKRYWSPFKKYTPNEKIETKLELVKNENREIMRMRSYYEDGTKKPREPWPEPDIYEDDEND